MILTKRSYLKKLDLDQYVYQWINNNFESKLLVHGDITFIFKDIDKELLEKAIHSLLITGIFDVNAKQLRNILINNPIFNINGKDKNLHDLIDDFMLNLAEIQAISKALELQVNNLILTKTED